MRLALAALLLGLACVPVHAQAPEKKAPPFKAESPKSERERDRRRERDRHREDDRHREHKPPASAREQSGPMNAPPFKPPANKQFGAHPSETRPRPTAPSVAEQQQRQMEEQRRVQQGEGTSDPRVFQCSARPVCGGGGYGRCASVQQTYRGGTAESRRKNMVDECIQANSPDTCQCAVQCRRVAHCNIF